MKKMFFLLTFSTLLLFTGCATDYQQATMMAGGYGQPVEYRQGFQAGCDSGYVSSGHPYYRFNKDVRRFVKDELYAQGWEDGFNRCKGQYEAIQRAGHY